ncbi:hypothetical protein PFLUV_G00105760 [Perca fluviatilis]|uniref:SAM domain-containing protein n=1 Tax=Perca fluviatilis TaxID=8168 RepID=A0A6A5F1I6_PERFL|nr:hypothetical protein PFLUV_G00105760 [Perca fluviatilis]
MTTTKPPSQPIEKWTEKDVQLWLMTEVKVQETCAVKFCEEEVSGDILVELEKTDILGLGIKHGPAVKITSYLESLKKGSQHESQIPAYVENWTKQQVFKDFLDLEVKGGPAVKILKKLGQLKNNSEPTLKPIPHTSTDQTEAAKPTQPELSLAEARATKQPESQKKIESKTDELVEKDFEKSQVPFKKASEKEEMHQPKPKDYGARRKETTRTTVLPDVPKITVEIQKTLDNLLKDDLKRFHFHEYTKSTNNMIPKGKLEGKDTMDTAKLMTEHYGEKEALRITIDILRNIDQRELALQLEKGWVRQPM